MHPLTIDISLPLVSVEIWYITTFIYPTQYFNEMTIHALILLVPILADRVETNLFLFPLSFATFFSFPSSLS